MNKPGESILSVPYVFYKDHDGRTYKYRPGCYWKFRHYSVEDMARESFKKRCYEFIRDGYEKYAKEEDCYENDN